MGMPTIECYYEFILGKILNKLYTSHETVTQRSGLRIIEGTDVVDMSDTRFYITFYHSFRHFSLLSALYLI